MSFETFRLQGDAGPIELESSGITLLAPGLVGAGTAATAETQTALRAFTRDTDEAAGALAEAGLEERHTIVMEAPTPPPGAAGRAFGAVADEELSLQVPLAHGEAAFVIYTDEAGQASFHYRRTAGDVLPTRAVSAARLDRFLVPLRPGIDRSGGSHRGLYGKTLSKIIRVIIVKLLPDQVGGAVARLVKAWEEKQRKHRGFHGGAPEELLAEVPQGCDLGRLRGQKSLLFIHGTTSSTAGAFGKLRGTELLARLYRRYEGRVVGFNHHTMGVGVRDNVRDIHAALASAPGDYLFDIVCHSRGGLVARALTALGPPPGGVRLDVDNVVFVATPNNGTDLAIPERIPQFVERLTNYVNMLPDSATSIAIGALLAIAGSIVETGIPRLPGLADQAPGSDLLKALEAAGAGARRYAAFQADYSAGGNLVSVVADKAVDRVFGMAKNDLVVPTEGVSRNLPIDDGRVVAISGGEVHHTNFFGDPRIARIADLLGA